MLWITTCGTVNAALFVALLLTRRTRNNQTKSPLRSARNVELTAALSNAVAGKPETILGAEIEDSSTAGDIGHESDLIPAVVAAGRL
jgi:hypothetical protein